MSLKRLMYYSAVIGGWSAFFGWLAAEMLVNRHNSGGRLIDVANGAMVGAAIGAGLNLVAGMANAQWRQQAKRILPGLLGGGVGGAVGALLGNVLFTTMGVPRAVGWMIMGAGIGIVEGLYERSPAKLRNGLIGGSIGGLIGGFLFEPIARLLASSSGMSSRATAFVILGLCIGLLIGLVKVVLKSAWLTVVDGYKPGRQLILSEGQAVLGRAEYATLPFVGYGDTDLELEHARILRQPDGRFALEDSNSRLGTMVNNVRVHGRVVLNDKDVIKIGTNMIEFSERQRHTDAAAQIATQSTSTYAPPPPVLSQGAPMPALVIPPPPGGVKPAPVIPPLPGGVKPAPVIPPRPGTGPPPLGSQPAVPDSIILCPKCRMRTSKTKKRCDICGTEL